MNPGNLANTVPRLAGLAAAFFLAGLFSGGALLAQKTSNQPSFGIVIIPDSQYLTATYTNLWNDQINWIISNQAACNIKAVMHLGDLVDYPNAVQLRQAMYGLNNLRNAGVPLILAPGNHDLDANGTPGPMIRLTTAGLTPNWFSNYPNYGAGWSMGFENPTNLLGSYLLITNGTQPCLLTCLAWQPNQTLVTWASNVVQSCSNIPAIYFEHIFVSDHPDGRMSSWSTIDSIERLISLGVSGLTAGSIFTPNRLWTNWISTTPNIFWVASGHETIDGNSSFYQSPALDGHIVTFTLTDFQNWMGGNEGSNFMQLVTFYPALNQAKVSTFSPTLPSNPLAKSDQYDIPIHRSTQTVQSGWQLKQLASSRSNGLALYVNFDGGSGSLLDLGPYAARMINNNLFFEQTELGLSAYFSDADQSTQGACVGLPIGRAGWNSDMELDQFSGLNQVTVSCWFKTTNLSWVAGPHALVGKFNTFTDGDFQLCVTPQSLLRFSVVNNLKSRVDLDVSAPAFDNGGWHHFCGVYDGTNQYSYFDSVLLGVAPQTGPIQTTVHAVAIGNNDTQNGYNWRGCLDEVKVLTTAWTPGLVSQEFQRLASILPPTDTAPPVIPPPPVMTNSASVTDTLASLPSIPGTNSLPLLATTYSTNVVLIYPAWASNFVIETSPSLAAGSWLELNAPLNLLGNYLVVGLPAPSSNMYFRLRQPAPP
jgi:hypothetical protein